MKKDFDNWNNKKKKINDDENKLLFNERDILWCRLGLNVGFEADGKHENFERPVLVLKRHNEETALVVTLTSKNKNSKWFLQVDEEGKFFANLSQIKLLSSKRFLRKSISISEKRFDLVLRKVVELNFDFLFDKTRNPLAGESGVAYANLIDKLYQDQNKSQEQSSVDIKKIKNYFKIFKNYKEKNKLENEKENNSDLVYLDSAASSLTPDIVIEKMNEYYFTYRSNIDRAISKNAIKATNEYDNSRKILAKFLNCDDDEIIWTSGATMASNMLIDMISEHDDEFKFLNEGDEILTTVLEHHSSLVPLQEFAKKKKMKIKFLELEQNPSAGAPSAPLKSRGANAITQTGLCLDLNSLKNLVNEKTKIVSICLASNVTGGINDIKKIITEIKNINKNVFVICDMTAAFGHIKINLNKNDKGDNINSLYNFIDAGYFSMHKAFGPTGVGVLFIKREISRNFSPTIFGGGMISHVEKENSEYRNDIKLFEAGTANISGVIGAGEAVKFLEEISIEKLEIKNRNLTKYAIEKLEELDFIKLFCAELEKNIGIISFQVFVKNGDNFIEVHTHDVAEILARKNISVRAGHHCAEPLMNYLNTKNGLTRISFHVYNNENDVDKLIEGLMEVKNVFEK